MDKEFVPNRGSEREQSRIADIFKLVPSAGQRAIDIGARDGYLSKRLADRFDSVVALDLERPRIDDPRIACVAGDLTSLEFPDRHFDFVMCCEVLEHIPPRLLSKACAELVRITRGAVLIGVPYRQDLLCGRTTCQTCGRPNPPYGHVNAFDEAKLSGLFAELAWTRSSFVDSVRSFSNPLSVALLDFASNPFGTYDQEESCVQCGGAIGSPGPRTLSQKIATRMAVAMLGIQGIFVKPYAAWIHVLFERVVTPPAGDRNRQ